MSRYAKLKAVYDQANGYKPYLADFGNTLTPIEAAVWMYIRAAGIPFYPQYPAHGVIFDFADPHKHIAIECDGKAWHDADKDAERDAKVLKHGWTVYRIPGHKCMRVLPNKQDLKEMLRYEEISESEHHERLYRWLDDTAEGIVSQIADRHYA